MKDSLEKIENFFKCDLEIKKMLYEMVPPIDCNYGQEYIIRYSDRLYNYLMTIKYYLVRTMNDFNIEYKYIEHVNRMFDDYNKKLADCGTDFNKLKQFYKDDISNMRESFIDDVKNNYAGYTMNRGNNTITKAKTVNELLHFLHHSITNNEKNYQNMPKLHEKNNDFNYQINLYGKENEIAERLYENFPLNLDVGDTDILALTNKILIMVRDRGHSLSIEINVKDNECDVRYFIPKICNTIMVNNLRGVHKVDENSKFTVGEFRNNINEIDDAIFNFIENVPMDSHMFIEGGAFYERSKGGR